jgi:cysteine-rich repeat protein
MKHRETSRRDGTRDGRSGLLSLIGGATALAVAGLPAGGVPAHAASEIILGKKVLIANPASTARTFLGLGKEKPTDIGLPGQKGLDAADDPVANGATLTIVASGTTSSSQTFTLPAGAFGGPTLPGWKQTPVGYIYKDPQRLNGPVKVVLIKRTPRDVAMMKAKVVGTDPGTSALTDLDIEPPNLGDEAGMILSINGGNSYCVRWGGPAGGNEKQDTATKFMIVSDSTVPTTEAGCPAPSGVCGNGVPEAGEECDDGDLIESDGCTSACTVCGNGVVAAPETCDDNNLVSGDGCDANCTPTGCGNAVVTAPETCDDGNTSNDDNCPSSCIILGCNPDFGSDRAVDVSVSSGNLVAGLTVLVDYPEDKVRIPGSGGAVPPGTITDLPLGSFGVTNDLDHALREVVAGAFPIADGLLFRVHFEDCLPLSVPSPGDFTCTVLAASDSSSVSLPGVTCAVTAVAP